MTYSWWIIIAAVKVFPGDHGPNKNEMFLGGRNKNSRSPFTIEYHFSLELFPLLLLVLFAISQASSRSSGIKEQKGLLSWKNSSSSQKKSRVVFVYLFVFSHQWRASKVNKSLWQLFRLLVVYPVFFSILLLTKALVIHNGAHIPL